MSKPTPYSDFIQPIPQLSNEFLTDTLLQDYLSTYLPKEMLTEITPDLIQFGERAAGEFRVWARDAEVNKPQLTQFDAFGNRVDEIKVADGWLKLERVAAEDGLVAIGFERKYGEYSRLYQFTKLYLYAASSAVYICPLAMTDGAARLIELYGDDELKDKPYKGLTSRIHEKFMTSGQWMTERTGGSDVSRSMTLASKTGDDYLLNGHKWFTSAITANMTFTLASTEQPEAGKRAPLSLFYMPIRDEHGKLNGIKVEALKDKLGTRALPTAQLVLRGAKAKMVGEKGKGVRTISSLFNITRIYNTISAVSFIRRAYSLSKAYSETREAFGQKIEQHLLHKKTLREMEIAYQSNTILALYLAKLLGKEECNTATETEKSLLRFLTPIAKLFTAKQAIQYASEHIETIGGLGYLEDSGIPALLRDAQVLSIWEGTTNVLSLDMLRAAEKEEGLSAFKTFVNDTLATKHLSTYNEQKEIIQEKANELFSFIDGIKNPSALVAASRDIAFYAAELTIALLWFEFIGQQKEASKYLPALNYWTAYKMDKKMLHSAVALNII
jgi:alkylation response protein AidB-like acyl-CoA dehydrogenase